MAFTYGGDPANSSLEAVRFYIQDTDGAAALFSDAEINYVLTEFANPLLAAAMLARTLAAKYKEKAQSKSVGDLRITYADRAAYYAALADRLQSSGEKSGVVPYVGGVSRADMDSVEDNADRVKQKFKIGMFDIPNSADSAQIPGEDCD